MYKQITTALLGICTYGAVMAQSTTPNTIIDGWDVLMKKCEQKNPNFRADLYELNKQIEQRADAYMQTNTANKTTAVKEVPIVFHIVLNQSQINQLGGTSGIAERIQSQIDVLNKDFNAGNADSSLIPAAFKPLYGNMGIKFFLAHKAPDGSYSPGYEIITTTKSGFDIQSGTAGTGYYCSDAKFTSSGGADAWDTKKYINVWVLNITPAGVGGVGTPPPYPAYGGTSMFPWNEQGIAISYMAFGKRANGSQFFPLQAAIAGRTLVHEMGHFFNLFHPFGMSTMDNKTCTDDDGVSDTPLESGPTQSICPSFPLLDTCSKTFPGVMYMNHMDYSADTCRTMFTIEQAARANVELAGGGYRDQLGSDPGLIYWWSSSVENVAANNEVSVYPNPATDACTINCNDIVAKRIDIINNLGQVVHTIVPAANETIIHADLSNLAKGVYTIKCSFANTTATTKLLHY